jgi:hypothetical protein
MEFQGGADYDPSDGMAAAKNANDRLWLNSAG